MTGIEMLPIAEGAIKGLATIVGSTAGKAGIQALGKTGTKLSREVQNLLFRISRQYIQNYMERHGILKVLGMREPVSLESVYTTVRVLNNDTIRGFLSVEALEKKFRQTDKRGFASKERSKRSGLKVANQTQYLMVLGGPGMGKSTFLRKVGLEALKGKPGSYQHRCIPVFVELKSFRYKDIDLESAIAQEFKNCGIPEAEKFTSKILEQGRLLLLLDGLDEVPTERTSEMITHIQDFADRHKSNRFICSCRVAAYRHNFRRFTDVAIADFDDEQIENFITNWFASQPEWGRECWQKLKSKDYAAAKELTHTPLLLTLVCLLYQRSGQFPTNRATLYERALRVLLEEWDAQKQVPRDPAYKGLDTKRKEILLSEIAYDAFLKDRLFLLRRDIAETIEELLVDLLPDEKCIDGAAVLKSIEVQHGVLVELAEDIYSFSHLTLQEFLTAQHLFDDRRQVRKTISAHLCDRRWREVFLLLVGIVRQADDVLIEMEREAQNFVAASKLQRLLEWAARITEGSADQIKLVEKRAKALTKAIANVNANAYANVYAHANTNVYAHANAYANALANAYVNTNIYANAHAINKFITYACELAKLQVFNINFTVLLAQLAALKATIPDDKKPRKVRRAFAQRIVQTWLEAFELTPELINLSKQETLAIENYLYANLLVVECRQAAVRVSRSTWQEIEARMLLPQAKRTGNRG